MDRAFRGNELPQALSFRDNSADDTGGDRRWAEAGGYRLRPRARAIRGCPNKAQRNFTVYLEIAIECRAGRKLPAH